MSVGNENNSFKNHWRLQYISQVFNLSLKLFKSLHSQNNTGLNKGY